MGKEIQESSQKKSITQNIIRLLILHLIWWLLSFSFTRDLLIVDLRINLITLAHSLNLFWQDAAQDKR